MTLIKKKWDSNCKDEAVNITYDLFQNGVRLTSNLQKPEDDKDPTSKSPVTVTEYGSKVIDYQSGSPKVTNEKAGIWTAIWKNLPKYINGRLVDYEVVETTITDSSGTHNHDEKADKEDGYRNYIVKYLYPKNGATDTTYDSNNNPINGKFEITITNKKDTGEQLLKLDAVTRHLILHRFRDFNHNPFHTCLGRYEMDCDFLRHIKFTFSNTNGWIKIILR